MLEFIVNALKIIFLLGFLVLIHEGGHFIVAKLCKIKVNQFAIGFGPTILKKQSKETLYALRLVPLGGFVSLEGEEERSEAEGSFSKTTIPKKIAIVAAGGLVNILFGLVVYFALVSMDGNYISNEIEQIQNQQLISQGLQKGDKIVKINGKDIHLNSDISKIISNLNSKEITLTVKRNKEQFEVNTELIEKQAKNVGIYFNNSQNGVSTEIALVYPESPADKAGLKVKDIIIEINGETVENNSEKVVEYIQNSEEEQIAIKVKRNNEEKIIEVIPNIVTTYTLGLYFKTAENSFYNNIYYGFWDTVNFSFSIVDNLRMLFTGQVKVEQLTGPIGIADMVSDTKGINDFIYLLALISLSLGVTNLLPFPPLDGGKIVIYIIEAIRRKPLKESIEINIQLIGFGLIIALSIFVAYNDILRIF